MVIETDDIARIIHNLRQAQTSVVLYIRPERAIHSSIFYVADIDRIITSNANVVETHLENDILIVNDKQVPSNAYTRLFMGDHVSTNEKILGKNRVFAADLIGLKNDGFAHGTGIDVGPIRHMKVISIMDSVMVLERNTHREES